MTTQEAQTIINNIKDPNNEKYKEAKAFLEAQQSSSKDTKNNIKGVNATKTPKKSGVRQVLSDIGTAMRNNQMGAGGASMTNAQPIIQQKIEDQKVIDETAEATGLERNKGLLKGNAADSKDVAQNLKDRGVAVTDEYKAKHSDVFNDFKVGKESKATEGTEETSGGGSGGNGSRSSSGLDYRTEKFMNDQRNIANKAKNDELDTIDVDKIKNWQDMYETSDKTVEAYKNIEDKYIQQLPTFMFRRYQNGEFGDISDTSTPEGRESKKNAQLRLAHFMINGLGTALSNASNVIKGKELEKSDYEKYQESNLEQGLANRWMKNNAETEQVIKLANKEADNEQDARLYVEKLTRDNNLKNAWNKMDQNQKLYSINVSREIGKLVGDMNLDDLSNFITARALDGSLSEDQTIVAGLATLVSRTPELLEKIPDDSKYKSALLKLFGK